MSVQELEKAITQLSVQELSEFAQWFAEFHHDEWDKQVISDSSAGRLNKLIAKANQDFEAGRCREM